MTRATSGGTDRRGNRAASGASGGESGAGGGTRAGIAGTALAVLVGLLIVAGGGYLYYSGLQATENAEQVDATVLSSTLVDNGPDDDEDRYTVRLRCRYTYEGETYISRDVCPGAGSACVPSSDSRSDVEDFLEDYQEGETVTAHVPPSNPSNAYLVQKSPSLLYLGVSAFGLVFVVLGLRDLVGD